MFVFLKMCLRRNFYSVLLQVVCMIVVPPYLLYMYTAWGSCLPVKLIISLLSLLQCIIVSITVLCGCKY